MKIDNISQAEVPNETLPEFPLSSREMLKLDTLLAFCMTKASFFSDLLLGGLPIVNTKDIWCAATDGRRLYMNSTKLFTYKLEEQCFVFCHEVLHVVLRHPAMMAKFKRLGYVPSNKGKMLPYIPDLMNRAMDYIVNPMLIWAAKDSTVPGRKWLFNPEWLFDPKYSEKGEEAVIDVYEMLLKDTGGGKQPPPPPPRGRGRPCEDGQPGEGRFDEVLEQPKDPGKSPEQQEQEDEIKWKVAVAGAAERAKKQGKLPGNLLRFANEYISPEVPWDEKIKAMLARRIGSDDLDFTRGERRLLCREPDAIFFPSASGYGCGMIICGFDTSGSIDKEIPYFVGGMVEILEMMNPQVLIIMTCDAKVHRVDYLEEASDMKAIQMLGFPGGGGTSFVPVFEKIKELDLEPDALVYFTDMAGTFPSQAPKYPVIWAATTDTKAKFGDHVRCKIK